MNRTFLLASSLSVALVTASCRDSATAPTSGSVVPSPSRSVQSPLTGRFGVDFGRLGLASSGMTVRDAALTGHRVINPSDYQCPTTPSPLEAWYVGKVDEVATQEPDIFETLFNYYGAADAPFVDALLFQTTDTPQYFGYTGEYTNVLRRTERDAKRFWDIFSADIQLIGWHGSMLLDVERVAAVYVAAYEGPNGPVSPEEGAEVAAAIRDLMVRSRTLNGGNHPIFSMNASTISAPGFLPDKIIMGDGMMAGYEAIGFGDVAPQVIYAHEFGHHIQIENGYFRDPYATAGSFAEQTRYTELMADAMATYFLTHKRGAAMNRKRVEAFLQAVYQIGDCAFTSFGHHGTPNQRMAAAQFGFDVADQAQKQGHVLTSEQFHALFVAAYPKLIAPDRL